jgi:epoxyqueuosine reductase QueG
LAVNEKDGSIINTEFQDFISNLKADSVGIASLEEQQGTRLAECALKLLPMAKSIVILAMEIYQEVIDLNSPGRKMGEVSFNDLTDRHMEYIGGQLTKTAYEVARFFHQSGFKALPLPSAGCPMDTRFLEAAMSYKHAARAAGMGYFGRSSLLIVPELGPRVRLAACLTEAYLEPTTGTYASNCESCNICIRNCPSGALAEPQNDDPYSMNKFACQAFRQAAGGCCECIRVCPAN